jgi:hypothetical protein
MAEAALTHSQTRSGLRMGSSAEPSVMKSDVLAKPGPAPHRADVMWLRPHTSGVFGPALAVWLGGKRTREEFHQLAPTNLRAGGISGRGAARLCARVLQQRTSRHRA